METAFRKELGDGRVLCFVRDARAQREGALAMLKGVIDILVSGGGEVKHGLLRDALVNLCAHRILEKQGARYRVLDKRWWREDPGPDARILEALPAASKAELADLAALRRGERRLIDELVTAGYIEKVGRGYKRTQKVT